MKKTYLLLLLFVFAGLYAEYCPFCDEKIITRQRYAENECTWGLYNYKPAVPGHCLVLPKRHVELFDDLTSEEVVGLYNMIKMTNIAARLVFGARAYMLEQNNGASVGQSVPHIHFHYLPNSSESGSIWSAILFRLKMLLFYPIRSQISDENIKKITMDLAQSIEK